MNKKRPLRSQAKPSSRVEAMFQEAVRLHQNGQLAQAEQKYRGLLVRDPLHADALLMLGHLCLNTARAQAGSALLRKAVTIAPDHGFAHFNLGLCQLKLGEFDAALASFDRTCQLMPDFADAQVNRGLVLQNLGWQRDAVAAFDHALALEPDNGNALNNKGISLQMRGMHEEAITAYQRAITLNPKNGVLHNNLGISRLAVGAYQAALDAFDRAIALVADYQEAWVNRGLALQRLKRFDEAVASFDHALALDPTSASAHKNKGISLLQLGRDEEAMASVEAGEQPSDRADALYVRGIALQNVGRHADALDHFDRALRLKDSRAEVFSHRGNTLRDLNRMEEALVSYEQASQLEADSATSHLNEALCRLLLGDFERGLPKYEWRWEADHQKGTRPTHRQPLWLGQDSLRGKTILLQAEQGIGDTIQFCRYTRLVAQLGAQVILEAPPALLPLLEGLTGVAQIVAKGEALPDFDCHCPLLSLPLALSTRLDSIPGDTPYLFVQPDRVAAWRERLALHPVPRIGLAWSGNPGFGNDANRSIPLVDFLQLQVPDLTFVSVQKDVREADAPVLRSHPEILHPGSELRNFGETAALIANLDLVIAVDTAVAHLAGALGKPVWILLPFNPDWRWLLNRSDSPWYPTARLFRQPRAGDWPTVLQQIVGELKKTFPV